MTSKKKAAKEKGKPHAKAQNSRTPAQKSMAAHGAR
jgi:hypothetical protein